MNRTRELLSDLVAMDTTSNRSNLGLVEYVEDQLDRVGVSHARVLNAEGTKANLLARIGPDVEDGVVLSGHLDCVPVDGQPWTRDPFALTQEDSRLYGRGACDMKGYIAAVLAAVPDMVRAPLQRPVLLAFTYDEELGTVGAPSAVAELMATQPRPAAAFIGEPTSMKVVNAHKGVRGFRVVVQGSDGHSSRPQGTANALTAATRIATFIEQLAEEFRHGPGDDRFSPPYTTFNLATLHGGQALNIVPRHAELTFEYRPVPGEDAEAIRDRIEQFLREEILADLQTGHSPGDVRLEPLALVRGLSAEPHGSAEQLARELSGDHGPATTVPFGTDGGHFQAAGISTVVVGPGSIEQAHQPDEWIEDRQLTACARFLDRLVDHLTTPR